MADDTSDSGEAPAGDFAGWLRGMNAALRGRRASDVPCSGCSACCTSSQFVHIGPDETDTLARIPGKLLFPAPGLPRGHVVLGYDRRGHCPMLVDNRCSIYRHRPRTCRTYDCRVFQAAGLDVEDDKPFIQRQARRWRFDFASEGDRDQRDAIRAAAKFLSVRSDLFPTGTAPANNTQLAVVALQVHGRFLVREEGTGRATVAEPRPDVMRAELVRRARRLRRRG